jgi:hypothetical protein
VKAFKETEGSAGFGCTEVVVLNGFPKLPKNKQPPPSKTT